MVTGRRKRFLGSWLLAVVMFVLAMPNTVFAATFKDVPSTHWAYTAVDFVCGKGYMATDASGNFSPDNQIDKFDTVKILAKIAGYKNTGATAAEQASYDKSYEANKGYISLYSGKFKRWNSTVNREIAFLLDKGILKPEDLNQFVILIPNSAGVEEERLRALSREEAITFIVRAMNRTAQALAYVPNNLFNDDADISSSMRSYIYYARSIKIISAAATFNPKGAITRASLAALLYNAFYTGTTTPTSTPAPTVKPTASPTKAPTPAPSADVRSVTGTISQVYSSFRGVLISSADSTVNNQVFRIMDNAEIKVNGAVKTFADLTPGSPFTAVMSRSDIISISVVSSNPTPAPTTQPQQPGSPSQYSEIEGIVRAISTTASDKYVTIELKILGPRGELYTELRNYQLASGCTITRGSTAASFDSLVSGDIATVKVYNTTVYSITVVEKNRNINGTVTDKQFTESGTLIYVITDSAGKSSNFIMSPTAVVYRSGSGIVPGSTRVNIGDTVTGKAEYDAITELYPIGSKSTKNVWVKDIYISNTITRVTGTDDKGVNFSYAVVPGMFDVYTLRVGTQVQLRLDSLEIEGFTLLSNAQAAGISGTVTAVGASTFTIRDSSSGYNINSEVRYDSATVVFDAVTGKTVSRSYLDVGMKVLIVYSEVDARYAKTISIISYK